MQAEKLTFKNKAEWLSERKNGIGGSDSPVILGVSPFKGKLDLWAEKRGLVDGAEETEAMRWGTRLQEAIRQGYEEDTRRAVLDQGIHTFVNKQFDYIRASVDGLIVPLKGQNHPWIWEAKSTGYVTERDLADDFPLHWEVQVQHEMFALGLSNASLAVLVRGNKLRWKDMERNDAFIEEMLKREIAFWESVVKGVAPEADDKESTARTLSRLYPKDTGHRLSLPSEAASCDWKRQEAIEAIKDAESQKREAENHIKQMMGDATFGNLPGGIEYSWKWGQRKGYEVKESEFRTLRRKG